MMIRWPIMRRGLGAWWFFGGLGGSWWEEFELYGGGTRIFERNPDLLLRTRALVGDLKHVVA